MTSIAFRRSSSEMTSGGEKRMLHKQTNKQTKVSTPDDDKHREDQEKKMPVKVKTHIFLCVGFASTPLLFNNKQNCHAVLPFLLFPSSNTTALNSPLPLTSFTSPPASLASFDEANSRNLARKSSPSLVDFSQRFSERMTSSAVMATAQPRGLPP